MFLENHWLRVRGSPEYNHLLRWDTCDGKNSSFAWGGAYVFFKNLNKQPKRGFGKN